MFLDSHFEDIKAAEDIPGLLSCMFSHDLATVEEACHAALQFTKSVQRIQKTALSQGNYLRNTPLQLRVEYIAVKSANLPMPARLHIPHPLEYCKAIPHGFFANYLLQRLNQHQRPLFELGNSIASYGGFDGGFRSKKHKEDLFHHLKSIQHIGDNFIATLLLHADMLQFIYSPRCYTPTLSKNVLCSKNQSWEYCVQPEHIVPHVVSHTESSFGMEWLVDASLMFPPDRGELYADPLSSRFYHLKETPESSDVFSALKRSRHHALFTLCQPYDQIPSLLFPRIYAMYSSILLSKMHYFVQNSAIALGINPTVFGPLTLESRLATVTIMLLDRENEPPPSNDVLGPFFSSVFSVILDCYYDEIQHFLSRRRVFHPGYSSIFGRDSNRIRRAEMGHPYSPPIPTAEEDRADLISIHKGCLSINQKFQALSPAPPRHRVQVSCDNKVSSLKPYGGKLQRGTLVLPHSGTYSLVAIHNIVSPP
jgi:hypothetical protein